MIQFPYHIPAALIGTAIVLVQPQLAVALSKDEVNAIAKEITVKISGENNGSGIIFEREGNTYYVLTNRHVIYQPGRYEIEAPDGEIYPVYYSEEVPGLDAVVLRFESDKTYPTADLGNSDQMTEATTIYVVGWADVLPGTNERTYQFTIGQITSRLTNPDQGYSLIYTNPTIPGTSGGPMLDEKGRVVGINGRAEIEPNTQRAFSFGIPINTFLVARNDLEQIDSTPVVAQEPTAQNLISLAGIKTEKGNYQEAIADLTQALRLSPNNPEAYYRRANAYYQLENYQAAIEDFNQVLRLNPDNAVAYFSRGYSRYKLGDLKGAVEDYTSAIRLNPDNAAAYNNRGIARYNLEDYEGAIEDYTQAIKLNPEFANAYISRGNARRNLEDYQGAIEDAYYGRGNAHYNLKDYEGAIEDYTQAIKLNPEFANAYISRGNARRNLEDYEGAIADYNQAIKLNPEYAYAYNNRGAARSDLKDYEGAITDYNQAIQLNPEYADAYIGRGIVRYNLGDYQGAIADYNQGIQLNPDYANAYYNRGLVNRNLGDKDKALEDFRQAAELYQQQGNRELYQNAQKIIRELEQE
jgi:tetratricopeptide (TPR) repeat protein